MARPQWIQARPGHTAPYIGTRVDLTDRAAPGAAGTHETARPWSGIGGRHRASGYVRECAAAEGSSVTRLKPAATPARRRPP